ncbi:MAG: phenylalanine--tRNA ligase subunit alpha [Eubacteriales bacterium]|nr:phenylalanine--tRNA ligase subunit alpha [Eubacteriales bacterium]MDD4389882.1 phenylalanine--tRNA ligase subunit alpha [Eubacteriales bacterium]
MQNKLNEILEQARADLSVASSIEETEAIRIKNLGKKGLITDILRSMGKLSHEEKKTLGQAANTAREEVEALINKKFKEVKENALNKKLSLEKIDVTEPGVRKTIGTPHIITITTQEIVNVFRSMGYSVIEGPEVDTVHYNFDALNAPKAHPSRDMSDTFYFSEDILLRTHTSPMEVRIMENMKPPIKAIVPGRCFRYDTPDATHSPMFHQVEGLVIDEGITMADLKGTLATFARLMFGEDTKINFRPHHFPFTEPSAEVDVSCFKCKGKGCNICKGSGWIEILGCGMTHPNVYRHGGVDPEKYTGFAFGMGVERVALLKYEIDDIRLLYENDMRFINQFK